MADDDPLPKAVVTNRDLFWRISGVGEELRDLSGKFQQLAIEFAGFKAETIGRVKRLEEDLDYIKTHGSPHDEQLRKEFDNHQTWHAEERKDKINNRAFYLQKEHGYREVIYWIVSILLVLAYYFNLLPRIPGK